VSWIIGNEIYHEIGCSSTHREEEDLAFIEESIASDTIPDDIRELLRSTDAIFNRLRQVPSLGCRAVAVPELKPCAIGGAAARYIETAAGLRVHEPALVSPAPLLGCRVVAIPELDFRAIGGPSTSGVQAFSEDT
jgi:hypothetical protein